MKLINFLSALLIVITYAICPAGKESTQADEKSTMQCHNAFPCAPASLHVILIRPI